MGPAGALRGHARRGGAVPSRRPHRGLDPRGCAEGGGSAPRAGAVRRHRAREGRLPPGARLALRRRAGADDGQHPTRVSHVAQDAGRHRRGGPVAGPRHRTERGDLLRLQSGVAASATGRGARAPRQPGGSPAQAGVYHRRSGRRVRRDLQLPDVPRPAARAGRVHRHRRAPQLQRPRGLRRPDHRRAGPPGLRIVFSRTGSLRRLPGGCSVPRATRRLAGTRSPSSATRSGRPSSAAHPT